MKFLVIVKANKDSEAGVMPSEKMLRDMAILMRNWSRLA